MRQIYDDPFFNDRVIRKTCHYFWDNKEAAIGNIIDQACIWENESTIVKIKFTLWKAIRNHGSVIIKKYCYEAPVDRLKFAYELLVKNEEEALAEEGKI